MTVPREDPRSRPLSTFRRRSQRAPWGLAAAFLLMVAGCSDESGQAQTAQAPEAPSPEASPDQDIVDLSQLGVDEGSIMTAVIAVADFSDFGCIFCADFHTNTYPALYEEFVAGGDVLWKYIPISVGGFPNGDLAGLTGICAQEVGPAGSFAEMRDHLFEQREEWLNADPAAARELFDSYAALIGLDADAFAACVDGDEAAATLQLNNDMSMRVGVTATPTFIIQGTPVRGAPPLPDFQAALRRVIAQAKGLPVEEVDPQGGPGA